MRQEPDAWQRAFREDGFAVVEGLLDPPTLSALREKLVGLTENADALAPHLKSKMFYEREHVKNNPHWYAGVLTPEECGDSVRQIDDLALFDPEFAKLIRHAPMLDVLETLYGSTEFGFVNMYGRPKAARYGNGISDGNYHRDTPFEDYTAHETILVILCLDDMTGGNGATSFVRGSHRVPVEEAKQPRWREVDKNSFGPDETAGVRCPAGSAVFFDTKILHAAGHNRSDETRHTILLEWVGPNVLPTSAERYAYQGLKPRSRDPLYRRQMSMTFPEPSALQA